MCINLYLSLVFWPLLLYYCFEAWVQMSCYIQERRKIALLNTKCSVVQYCGWLRLWLSQVQADGEGGHHGAEDLHSGPKKCWKDGIELLKEVKKTPHCETVTKQQCDSRWIINEYRQKVFDGNENCKDVSWEDCRQLWCSSQCGSGMAQLLSTINCTIQSCLFLIDDNLVFHEWARFQTLISVI